MPATADTPQAGAVLRYHVRTSTAPLRPERWHTASNTTAAVPREHRVQNIPGITASAYRTALSPNPASILDGLTGTCSTGQTVPAGLADFGTRLKAVFINIPAGVNVYVSTSNVNFTTWRDQLRPGAATTRSASPTGTIAKSPRSALNALALLVMGRSWFRTSKAACKARSSVTVNGVGLYQVTLTNGAGEAVLGSGAGRDPSRANLDFGVFFQYSRLPRPRRL